MSSTWEEPDQAAPVEAPSPADAPTGGEEADGGQTEQTGKNPSVNREPDDVGTVAAGEGGDASDGVGGRYEVVIGEIPDAADLAKMLWTARCTVHGLLGSADTKENAEVIGEGHRSTHG
jgi:hypothetical protein